MYVIVRDEDGKYVTPPGQDKSYTTKLQEAQGFSSIDAATKFGVCGNESIVPISSIVRS